MIEAYRPPAVRRRGVQDHGDLRGGTESTESGADSSGTDRGGTCSVSAQLADAFLRHGASVYALARNVAGPAAAEQVTVGAFLALKRMPRDLSGGAPFLRPSLLALAHRHAVHLLRSDPDRRSRLAAMAPSDVERASWDRIGARAGELLFRLAPDQRRAIVLAYYGGHDCRELAAVLGQAEETVKAHLQTGLRRLREEMDRTHSGGGLRSDSSS